MLQNGPELCPVDSLLTQEEKKQSRFIGSWPSYCCSGHDLVHTGEKKTPVWTKSKDTQHVSAKPPFEMCLDFDVFDWRATSGGCGIKPNNDKQPIKIRTQIQKHREKKTRFRHSRLGSLKPNGTLLTKSTRTLKTTGNRRRSLGSRAGRLIHFKSDSSVKTTFKRGKIGKLINLWNAAALCTWRPKTGFRSLEIMIKYCLL